MGSKAKSAGEGDLSEEAEETSREILLTADKVTQPSLDQIKLMSPE
jgi:hypothetical protein